MLTMTTEEQLTLDIIVKISSGEMGRKQGQQALTVSERTMRRYLSEYQKKGPAFVKHGNYNKAPSNLNDPELKKTIQKLVKDVYFDLNVTHLNEKLKSNHGIEINRETLRQYCHEIKMVKRAKKRRSSKARRRRDRMAQTGIMLQMDGSPDYWFGGKQSCLIGAIDDADSDVPFAEFFPAEDTISCMVVLQKIIEKVGIFQILYVDKAGIFGGGKRSNFSQVKRALRELGIHIIFADSPEAKGRIERLWDTFQDRLIPEMRLRGIKSYETANDYLQNQFLPNEYAKFKVVPENLVTAYKAVPKHIDLNEVFCLKKYRGCKRDHTFSLDNDLYRIDCDLKHSIHKQQIEVRTYQDLSRKFFFSGKEIKVSLVKIPIKQSILEKVEELHGNKVRQDGHVECAGKYYSVDERFIGQKVNGIEMEGVIQFYHQGIVIEAHSKITDPKQVSATKENHLSPWRRALELNSMYRKNSRRYGASVEDFVVAVIKQGHGFVDTALIFGVLNQDKNYEAKTINEVCKHALDIDSINYKTVMMLLKLKSTRFDQKQAEMRLK